MPLIFFEMQSEYHHLQNMRIKVVSSAHPENPYYDLQVRQ